MPLIHLLDKQILVMENNLGEVAHICIRFKFAREGVLFRIMICPYSMKAAQSNANTGFGVGSRTAVDCQNYLPPTVDDLSNNGIILI